MTPTLTPPGPNIMPSVRLFTAADLAAMPRDLPSGTVKWELDRGRLVSMPPPGDEHGVIHGELVAQLKVQGDWRGHGQSRIESGVVLERGPDTVKGPDASFIRASRLPAVRGPEGYLETIPDLIVEVRSKNDTLAELQRKADDYLAAGAVVVWVVNPVAQEVIESRQGGHQRIYGAADTLTIDDVIPGFALPVRDLFA